MKEPVREFRGLILYRLVEEFAAVLRASGRAEAATRAEAADFHIPLPFTEEAKRWLPEEREGFTRFRAAARAFRDGNPGASEDMRAAIRYLRDAFSSSISSDPYPFAAARQAAAEEDEILAARDP
jgi:hypothetical protein